MGVVVLMGVMLFNGGLLWYVFLWLLSDFRWDYRPLTSLEIFLCAVVAFAVVVSLAFVMDSGLGRWVLRVLCGARPMIGRERNRTGPILDDVQRAIKHRQGLAPLDVHLMMVDEALPNAMAIGKNTVVVSRSLCETSDDAQLAGVLAHELGHLHRGDSRRLAIAVGVSLITVVLSTLAQWVVRSINGLRQCVPQNASGLMVHFFSFLFTVIAWVFLAVTFVGHKSLALALLFVGRKEEYRADQFAVQAGYGEGLLAFLEQVKDIQWGSQAGFMGRLMATHPAVMLRIGKVEEKIGLHRS